MMQQFTDPSGRDIALEDGKWYELKTVYSPRHATYNADGSITESGGQGRLVRIPIEKPAVLHPLTSAIIDE